MKKAVISIFVLFFALLMGSAQAAGNAAKGKEKAGMCMGCHGAQGVSSNPLWPHLAGQSAGYIAKQLADFKSGIRKDPTMSAMAAGLSQADMENLGAYYSELKPAQGAASSEKLAQQGERMYRGGKAEMGISACMSCHGPSGKGIPPRFPSVSGQQAAYAEKQLLAFKTGSRSNDDEIMTRIAFRMSEAEIKAIAEYMAGLH
ncbi:MAG: cytochrome c4 [Gammaproteobacteria bacterium]|nr:cytochrome c4 [Gammaproteobacteria bacterium]